MDCESSEKYYFNQVTIVIDIWPLWNYETACTPEQHPSWLVQDFSSTILLLLQFEHKLKSEPGSKPGSCKLKPKSRYQGQGKNRTTKTRQTKVMLLFKVKVNVKIKPRYRTRTKAEDLLLATSSRSTPSLSLSEGKGSLATKWLMTFDDVFDIFNSFWTLLVTRHLLQHIHTFLH